MSDPGSLEELKMAIRHYVDERDWDQFHNPKDLAIALVLEATEVLEHFQWKNEAQVDEHAVTNKSEIADELADTFYCLLMLANKLDIDLIDASHKKLAKNAKKYPVDKAKGSSKKYTNL